jgi:hypothetical protein
MARRLAVVTIQPPGFGGRPSWRQRSTATVKASATASSASSTSPRRRIRVALEGTHLDVALARGRAALRDLQRLVEVLCLDHPEAAELLLGLRPRSVGDQGRALLVADGRGGLLGVQPAREHPRAALLQLLVEPVDLREHRLHDLRLGGREVALVVHRQQVLLHDVLLVPVTGRPGPRTAYERGAPGSTAWQKIASRSRGRVAA